MKKIVNIVLVATLVFSFVMTITPTASAGGPGGFQVLTGDAAANFRLPPGLDKAGKSDNPAVERYQQKFGEALVLGGQTTIYRDANGKAKAVIGARYDITPKNKVILDKSNAQVIAAEKIGNDGKWITDLMINPQTGRYFYRVENRREDSRWYHWVDAETGEIVNAYNGLTTGTGIGVLGDTKNLTGLTSYVSGAYKLQTPDGRQKTYDAKNRSTLPGTLASDSDDTWNLTGRTSPAHPAMVDAHFYARTTDNYYLNTHGFNWLTYYPQGMVSSAHLQRNYVNAYWNGSQMAYGDGDGVTFRELSGDLDVVAHELSHGVTEATSGLIYQNESGALNEAFSDIMGTAVEFYYGTGNWTIGEDIDMVSNGLRNMANPNEDGDPSHYADRYTGTSDYGGVHTNNGIANHWFYLLVNGGQNANPARASGTNVIGIGIQLAEQIAFDGFTGLPENATFCDARAATVAVAGTKAANVADAWDEVGVDEALCGGGGGGTGSLNVTVTTDKASYKFNQTAYITIHVADGNGAAVSGATINVSIKTPKLQTYTGSGTTDASGNIVFTFTPNTTTGAGTYTVSATATKTGYTTGTGSTTFTAYK